jgi:hypothetical protein
MYQNLLVLGTAPRFLDTKYFSFSMFKTDNVAHFDFELSDKDKKDIQPPNLCYVNIDSIHFM